MTAVAGSAGARPGSRFSDCAFLYALSGSAQAIVLWSAVAGDIGLPLALGYHLGLLTLVSGGATLLAHRLETHHVVSLFLLALGGPIGAALAIGFSRRVIGAQPEAPPELLAWYDTLAGQGPDFTARLSDTEAEDDMALLDPGAPTLKDTVRSGTLAQKRNAIARMAAAYHPDYHCLLTSALADPEPTIRVQAAAVLTGLGQEERDRLDARIETLAHAPDDALADSAEAMTRHITSRLLDAEGTRLAVRAIAFIADRVLSRGASDDMAKLRMQLVWCAHGVTGDEAVVLRALLDKLVAHQGLGRAS